MIEVVGDAFPFAVGVATSPLPLIAVVLVLLNPHGRSAGPGFAIGRVVGIVAVTTAFALLSELVSDSTDSSTTVAIVRIVAGFGLMGFALLKFRKRPQGDDVAELPGWMSSLDNMAFAGALRFGFIISVLNPKELAFGIGAGLTIGNSDLSTPETIGVAVVYTAIAALGVIAPVIAFLIAGNRMVQQLEAAKSWLIRNNAVVIGVVLLILGAMLVGGGISKL